MTKLNLTADQKLTAKELGLSAFNRGAKRTPLADAEFIKLIAGFSLCGRTVKALKIYELAWDTANLSAPLN